MKNNIARDIKATGTVVLILGIISSIIMGVITMMDLLLVGLITLVVGCISSFIPYLIFIGFAEIIEKLTQIELNTRVVKVEKQSSKREITNKEDKIEDIIEEAIPQNNCWICPECCREIDEKVDTCKCGYEKK